MTTPPVDKRFKQRGLSLIELMVSLTIGLFLMVGVASLLSSNMQFSTTSAKFVRLSQEMRAAMSFMQRDIRRAGAWGNAFASLSSTTTTNPFYNVDASSPGCILFTYDADQDGTQNTSSGSDERYGFLLDSNAIKMRNGSSTYSCANSSEWEAITSNAVKITALTFTVISEAATSNTKVTVRKVTISMTGQLASDSSVTQSFTETVKISNNKYN